MEQLGSYWTDIYEILCELFPKTCGEYSIFTKVGQE